MANMNGIEIKSVKSFYGRKGYVSQGSLYLDKKKIGFYSEDEEADELPVRFDCDETGKRIFRERIRQHFEKYPLLDYEKIQQMSIEEYRLKQKNQQLPLMNMEQEAEDFVLRTFMKELLHIRKMEQSYKKAVKTGYQAIMEVHYILLEGCMNRKDEIYYTNEPVKIYEKVYLESREEGLAVELKLYMSKKDFVIY